MSKQKRILLVDDHPMFLDGLLLILEQQDMSVVAVGNANEALEALEAVAADKHFDLILMDIKMPGLDGYALMKALKERQIFTPVIIISASEESYDIARALENGASGYLPKTVQAIKISEAIDKVIDGEVYIAPELSYDPSKIKKSARANRPDRQVSEKISARQIDILTLTAEGYSNSDIALAQNIAEVTVKYHLNAIFNILKVKNRTACVKRAQELGIIAKH